MQDSSLRSPFFAAMTACTGLMLAIGLWARCTHLDRRVFWGDEVITSLRVSGYTTDDVKRDLFDGRLHTPADVAAYQTPGKLATVPRIVASLAVEDAQHPPLYYVVERGWIGMFGNDIAARRSLSTVFSIAALLALYWLCRELFPLQITAMTTIALAAISPFFEVYAKQAREYSLWELLVLCSAAAIVRAAKQPSALRWQIVSFVALVLTAYTFLFGIFSAVSGLAYIALRARFVKTVAFVRLGIVCVAALLAAVPWIAIVVTHGNRIAESNAWSAASWPLPYLFAKLCLNVVSPFYDVPLFDVHSAVTAVPLFLLLLAAVRYFRSASVEARIFVATLVAPTILFVILPDIATHAHRSSVTRYLLPMYIALQLIAGYAISDLLRTAKTRVAGVLVFTCVLALELQATVMQQRADVWWDNQSAWPVPQIGAALSNRPVLLIDETDLSTLVGILPYLHFDSHLILGSSNDRAFAAGAYLLSPTDDALHRVARLHLVARLIPLASPLQHSAHVIGSAALTHAKNNGDATLYAIEAPSPR